MSLVLSGFLIAQENDKDSSSLGNVLQTLFSKDGPNLGLLGQFDAEVRDNGNVTNSSFNVHLLRLYVYGAFGEKFSYVFQGDINGGYRLLDVKFSYKFNDDWRLDAGQFKAPFGKEFLRNDAKLLFVNRATVEQVLILDRQRGVQLSALCFDDRLSLTAGVFNGSRVMFTDSKISLFAANVSFKPIKSNDLFDLEVGGSSAYSKEEDDLNWLPYSSEQKALDAVNVRIRYDEYILESEYIVMEFRDVKNAKGFYADVVRKFGTDWDVALRYDWINFDRNNYAISSFGHSPVFNIQQKYVAGINWYPLKPIKLQLNYERDQTNKINAGYLNFQYAVNYEH